jgi:unsaturated rhamnogalacturonyl hydrolase
MRFARRGAVALVLAAFASAACSKSSSGISPACTATSPSTSDPFAKAHAPDSAQIALARAIADRYMTENPPTSVAWGWGEGTLMEGIAELYRVTTAPTYRDYLRQWMDPYVANGYSVTKSDDCPPALSAIVLYQTSCSDGYANVVQTVLHLLYDDALRTSDGGISHFGTSTIFPPTLWIDSLFMFGSVLVRWGEASGDARALDEYASQYKVFQSHLQDSTGFFVHAFNWVAPQDPGVYWGRGNGWVVASGFDYLRVRAARGETDDAILSSLRQLALAITKAQDTATGLWWTVVNRPGETYLETSASALFALGLARGYRAGLLDASVLPTVHHAMDGVRTKIVLDAQGRPVVTGVSGPTDPGRFSTYASVPVQSDLTYGVGAVILALIEESGI